ncbi:MAG: RidA family protein [Bacteroidota bacterium]
MSMIRAIVFLMVMMPLAGICQTKIFIDPYATGYSGAVVTEGGRTIRVSGQTAPDATGAAKGNLRLQTEQVYEQIGKLLAKAGGTFADIVKMNIYVVNYKPEDLPVIREVRARYLNQQQPPASTLVGVQALFHPDILIEIDVEAVVK